MAAGTKRFGSILILLKWKGDLRAVCVLRVSGQVGRGWCIAGVDEVMLCGFDREAMTPREKRRYVEVEADTLKMIRLRKSGGISADEQAPLLRPPEYHRRRCT